MELRQHPLSAAFPSMSAEDFQSLKDDIEVNGQREAVTVFEDMVLDGWHRYRACMELALPVAQSEFTDADPVAFVKSVNYHRRHMSGSQRAASIVALSQWVAPHRPKKGEVASPLSKTNAQLATEAKVSVKTIKDAKAAHKAGLGDAVKEGAMTAEQAAGVARGAVVKAAKPAKVEPEEVTYTGPSDAEIADAIAGAKDDTEALQALLDADDKLAALAAINDQLRAELAVVKLARDGYMNRSNELIARIKSLRSKITKLEQPA